MINIKCPYYYCDGRSLKLKMENMESKDPKVLYCPDCDEYISLDEIAEEDLEEI